MTENNSNHLDESQSLAGHVAVITGGRRGIGRAIMRRLSAHGASVVFTCINTSEEFVSETSEILEKSGVPWGRVEVDLSDGDARADVIERASKFFGPPDILVNNAATGDGSLPSASPLSRRRVMFEVNVHAPVDLIQQALPAMLEKGWGRVVNILSDSIHQQPVPYLSPPATLHGLTGYGASKAALERFTLGFAGELAGTGVHVNGFYPHKVAVTESQSDRATAALRSLPWVAENLETMAEAAYQLIAGSHTGVSSSSRALLHHLQQPVRALDGVTVIGDAATVPEL